MKASRTQHQKGVFVVLEGETLAPTPNFGQRRDTDKFAVCFDAIDKSGVSELFRASVQAVLTSLSLSLSAKADRQIERVGEVVYPPIIDSI